MLKLHNRTDLRYQVIRGRAFFTRSAYACVITQATAYADQRAIYHVETFYGDDGVRTRAAARRYGAAVCNGSKLPYPWREQYLPAQFPREGVPPREDEIAIREEACK